MAGIDEVLERLVTDAEFRAQLHEDPAKALEGYDLDSSDLELLAVQVTEGMGEGGAVEQRTSKSAVAGMLGALIGDDAAQSTGKFDGSYQLASVHHHTPEPPDGEEVVLIGEVSGSVAPVDDGAAEDQGAIADQPTTAPFKVETETFVLTATAPEVAAPGEDDGTVIVDGKPGTAAASSAPPGEDEGIIDDNTRGIAAEPAAPSQDAGGERSFSAKVIDDSASATPGEGTGVLTDIPAVAAEPAPPDQHELIADELGIAEDGTASETSNYNIRETFPTKYPDDSPPPESDLLEGGSRQGSD